MIYLMFRCQSAQLFYLNLDVNYKAAIILDIFNVGSG